MPASAHAARTAAAPLGDRRRRLALDVGHAEAAADRQLGQAVGVDEGGQHLDGLDEGVDDEDLAADVGVQPDQVDRAAMAPSALDGLAGGAGLEAEAELGVVLAGPHVLVGVGLDARA